MPLIDEILSVLGSLFISALILAAIIVGLAALAEAGDRIGFLGASIVGLLEAIAVLLFLIYRRLPPPPKP